MHRAQEIARSLTRAADSEGSELRDQADVLLRVLQQITDGMKEIQVLFKSSRRRRKVLQVEPVLKRIHKLYKTLLKQRQIQLPECHGRQVATDSQHYGWRDHAGSGQLVRQCLLLAGGRGSGRTGDLCVTIDRNQGTLTFSDSGPGIDPDDLPYIFEPFYSGKGQEGRGLGLYIARQLLERHGYRIEAAESQPKILSGANFVVSLDPGGQGMRLKDLMSGIGVVIDDSVNANAADRDAEDMLL